MSRAVVRTLGNRSSVPTVFFHGCPGGSGDWDLVMRHAGDAHVVLVDMPDHGAAPPSTLDTAGLVEEAARVVEALDVPAVRLVGHSMGAYLVARLLPRMRERVERAVFVAGLARSDEQGVRIREGMKEQLASGQLTAPELVDVGVALFLGSENDLEARRRCRSLLQSVTTERWLRHLDRTIALGDPEMAIPCCDVPSVALHGERDAAVPLEAGEQLAELTGAAMVIVDTDAHALPLTHPELVARHVFG